MNFKANVTPSTDALLDDGGIVTGNAGIGGVEGGHFQVVDPSGEDWVGADAANAKAVPVIDFPYLAKLIVARRVGNFGVRKVGFDLSLAQILHCKVLAHVAIDDGGSGEVAAETVGEKSADAAIGPVIAEHLEPDRASLVLAEKNAGVGLPIGAHFVFEFEITVFIFGHEIGAKATAGRILAALDRSVDHLPVTEMLPRSGIRENFEAKAVKVETLTSSSTKSEAPA